MINGKLRVEKRELELRKVSEQPQKREKYFKMKE